MSILYRIVIAATAERLQDDVNRLLDKRWCLQGGVSYDGSTRERFAQAMVKGVRIVDTGDNGK